MSDATPKILIQLDGDRQASTFDAVVAIDAGADHLLRHHGVRPEEVRDLVYGAIFTRAADQLHRTAIFVGGSDVTAGEALLAEVCRTFFGPMRVSVMMDSNGANTTAAAAVLAAAAHVPLRGTTALVLAATGPVGRRVAHLLASQGAEVRAASRSLDRARAVCETVAARVPGAKIGPWIASTPQETAAAAQGCRIVISAGAPGVELMPADVRRQSRDLATAIDLSAVPPAGLEGVDPRDRATDRDGVTCYGALGIGATKMKIHKAAIRKLFESNDQVLDVDEIFALARAL
jgi:hypothetical protein